MRRYEEDEKIAGEAVSMLEETEEEQEHGDGAQASAANNDSQTPIANGSSGYHPTTEMVIV